MDARRPHFLDGHIDPDAVREEVIGTTLAVTNGRLTGPSVTCTYIAKVSCTESLVVDPSSPYRLELDMYVDELADLELRMRDLGRFRRRIHAGARDTRDLLELWVDQSVVDAWDALVDYARDDEPGDLVIRSGACVFAGSLPGHDREHMQRIVDVVAAIADVPARRMQQLDIVLDRWEGRRGPQRLRLGGAGPVVVGWGCEIGLDVVREPDVDCAGRQLRTRVRVASSRMTGLAVVDAADEHVRPPGRHGPTIIGTGERRWLTSDEGLLARDHELIERALIAFAPTTIVATGGEIVINFAGWMGDTARLAAAVELAGTLAGGAAGTPYR